MCSWWQLQWVQFQKHAQSALGIVVALIVDKVYWVFADQVNSRNEDVTDGVIRRSLSHPISNCNQTFFPTWFVVCHHTQK